MYIMGYKAHLFKPGVIGFGAMFLLPFFPIGLPLILILYFQQSLGIGHNRVNKGLFLRVILQHAGSIDDIVVRQGDANIEVTKLAIELPHIQIGIGMPAVTVVDNHLRVPLRGRIVFPPGVPHTGEYFREFTLKIHINGHGISRQKRLVQKYLYLIDVVFFELWF